MTHFRIESKWDTVPLIGVHTAQRLIDEYLVLGGHSRSEHEFCYAHCLHTIFWSEHELPNKLRQ